ncbi:hypothetical protein CAG54_04785 [Vibrio sp. V27_P1S3P104]|uniref:hypothetical protein n=1 Tax=unclassified Vibrio TaxID=2614977 RepID=UPI001372B0CE|nr:MULTISPECIES: hypothetical protein [unclassified Vibrio]NAW68181.1 hypothetical protein [Vibrio sp. V28_P6S34P95]NAX04147.1 hypothetical protein [Vibrio sp. V30_P3S12P165]NAX35627.1 hypothetical protein [Vibrio sp. V29_P1S30P107]NAX36837.1 hypothetical protein [Vibrio sp. V27_P1S3P104]
MAELVQLNKVKCVDDVGSHNWLMRVLLEQQSGSNYPAVIQQNLMENEQLKSRVVQEPLMELKVNLAEISLERWCLCL